MPLRCPGAEVADAKEAFANDIAPCPAAQSIRDCIKLEDAPILERETGGRDFYRREKMK